MSKKKKPKFTSSPASRKTPFTGNVSPTEKKPCFADMEREEFPNWHFGLMDCNGPFGWDGADKGRLQKLLSQIKDLESKRWREILQTPGKKRHHFMEIAAIDAKAIRRLEELKLEDRDPLFSFRIGQQERLWGFVDGNVFRVLWWDPDHLVYPMNITDN